MYYIMYFIGYVETHTFNYTHIFIYLFGMQTIFLFNDLVSTTAQKNKNTNMTVNGDAAVVAFTQSWSQSLSER